MIDMVRVPSRRIDFGYGTMNPKLWGNKPKEQKKKKMKPSEEDLKKGG